MSQATSNRQALQAWVLARQGDWTGVNIILRGLTTQELKRVIDDAAALADYAKKEALAWQREVAQ